MWLESGLFACCRDLLYCWKNVVSTGCYFFPYYNFSVKQNPDPKGHLTLLFLNFPNWWLTTQIRFQHMNLAPVLMEFQLEFALLCTGSTVEFIAWWLCIFGVGANSVDLRAGSFCHDNVPMAKSQTVFWPLTWVRPSALFLHCPLSAPSSRFFWSTNKATSWSGIKLRACREIEGKTTLELEKLIFAGNSMKWKLAFVSPTKKSCDWCKINEVWNLILNRNIWSAHVFRFCHVIVTCNKFTHTRKRSSPSRVVPSVSSRPMLWHQKASKSIKKHQKMRMRFFFTTPSHQNKNVSQLQCTPHTGPWHPDHHKIQTN